MLESFVHWLVDTFRALGYPGIIFLMALESSVLPVPSELIMPPAGYLVAKGEMDLALVLLCGVLGSVLGALANYGVALWLGRALVRRYGRYVLITEKGLDRSERFFVRHGEISTFISRMLPVLRHLISIPAGLARMPLPRFIVFTALGAFIWCGVLTAVGYFLGRHEAAFDALAVNHELGRVITILIPALAALTVAYVVWYRRRARSIP
ncbi:MAG TPA: DedA family protein [Gemmatimonadales bacterium]|nr:DedA family protein [Gemmatimonadales bacterium]